MEETLIAADGTPLHVRRWMIAEGGPRPTQRGPRGTVLIVHGLGEHIGRYGHVAADLNARGWNVVGFDLRGHGCSGGTRGRLARSDDFLRDCAQVLDAAGATVLLGHSLGGLIAARFVAEGLSARPAAWFRRVDALVLSSPALDPGMSAAQKLLLAVLAPLAPSLALNNGVVPAHVSRDPAVVRAYVEDPLVHDRVTPRLVRFIVDSAAFVLAHAARWNVPTLLMYAGSDRCVASAGSIAFAAAAPRETVAVREFPELFHEILNEPEQGEVLETMGAWLAGQGPRYS